MAIEVARWINAQTSMTTALDWTLLLLVISVLVTNINCLMQCTHAPATCDCFQFAIKLVSVIMDFHHSQTEKWKWKFFFSAISIKQNLRTSIYVHLCQAKYANLHFHPF